MKEITKPQSFIDSVNEIIENGRSQNILQLYTEDIFYDGRTITLDGRETLNFGSCSYLGLELDERLKKAAIEAINSFGIQFSSSRSYMSFSLYTELETLVKQIFNACAVLTPTTTLGHQAVIPVVVEKGDLIILDQQVHASVQYAAFNMQNKGISTVLVRHNNLSELEEKLIENSHLYKRIWYMGDGIYSMYGDYMPIEPLIKLLDKYPKMYLYVDDAHGMSWTGRNGRGYVLGKVDLHAKMIVGTSFAKAFGTGGGVFLFADQELCQKVRNCGGPLIFSGPNQVPVVAASIASAKIHLSDEIYSLQKDLKEKILYCHNLLLEYDLPVVSNPETPIKFIGLGLTRVGYNMIKRLLQDGFYCNLAIFPAVPETCTGLRFTITNHHTFDDLKKLVSSLVFHFPKALAEEGRTMMDIQRAFRKVIDFKINKEQSSLALWKKPSRFRVQHETTIEFIPEFLWNKLLAKGSFDWKWLKFIEQTFKNNEGKEYNWDFHYYIIWDNDCPVLATFFTCTFGKDDMLSSESVSYRIEIERTKDFYYLCSKTFMMGAPITEGEHLYLDKSSESWKDVLMLLLDNVWNEQLLQQANSLCLRDFNSSDKEIADFLMNQGFIKISLPDNHILNNTAGNSREHYLKRFNARERWYLKDNVLKYEHLINFSIVKNPSNEDVEKFYELYKNVKGKSFELNTFDLPKKMFFEMAKNRDCEILKITLPENPKKIIAVTFNILTSANNYCGIVIGLDYNFLKTHSVYKQMLFQSILRAAQLNASDFYLGFTASSVKRKFGAIAKAQCAYFQTHDNYSMAVINGIANSHDLITTN